MGVLQLGCVVLQLALRTDPNACQAQLFKQSFCHQMSVCSVESVLEVAVALRQDNEDGSPNHT